MHPVLGFYYLLFSFFFFLFLCYTSLLMFLFFSFHLLFFFLSLIFTLRRSVEFLHQDRDWVLHNHYYNYFTGVHYFPQLFFHRLRWVTYPTFTISLVLTQVSLIGHTRYSSNDIVVVLPLAEGILVVFLLALYLQPTSFPTAGCFEHFLVIMYLSHTAL